jgi:protoporphyrinogen oxidase
LLCLSAGIVITPRVYPMFSANDQSRLTVVMGGGLTGLAAGCVLTRAGLKVRVFEKDADVGGLSKTIEKEGFRFDLGGHRFFTKDERLNRFVHELMGDELVSVHRTSKIYMGGKYFDYPLRPLNAVFGLGVGTTAKILADYGMEKVRGLLKKAGPVSLEDWVVANFGRTMFNIYFREYSEKVWGLGCSRISAEWVEQRIQGLSLAKAVKNAVFHAGSKDVPTLVDSFAYPRLGIGRVSDRLSQEIEKGNEVLTGTRVERMIRSGFEIQGVEVKNGGSREMIGGDEFVSSLPLPHVVRMLNPLPPADILEAAMRLRFRDLVVVAVMVDRKRVTDLTWIYIPERNIPFGRIHEPANWSEEMAPEGKTAVVTEYFSFRGDGLWNTDDDTLVDVTVRDLVALGFISKREVIGGAVVRVPGAYPLFDVGYKKACNTIYDYLGRFENLHLAGRGGMFRYYNMDHAMESGIDTAEKIIKKVRSEESGVRSKADDDRAQIDSCQEICRS